MIDVLIVGAGIVGLAASARVARPEREVLVVERQDGICRETSSRNSEVVHAGIYYPQGSLKARTCVRGRRLIYERCDARGIAAPRVGKWIVATAPEQLEPLAALHAAGLANGVEELELVEGAAALRARHPELRGLAALWSPVTGVVDSHALAASYEREARAGGAELVLHTEVIGAEPIPGGFSVVTRHPPNGEEFPVEARVVVNASGLGQPALSAAVGLPLDDLRQYPVRGQWFAVADRHRGRVDSLIYPVASAADKGLGVHLCLDVGGGMRIGPDAVRIEGPPFDLRPDPSAEAAFLAAARRIMPWIEPGDLRADMAGVRPKLQAPGGPWRDFVVRSEQSLPGWITLAGIESPGLTAAPALAEIVEGMVKERLG